MYLIIFILLIIMLVFLYSSLVVSKLTDNFE